MANALDVKVEKNGSTATVAVIGRVDTTSAPVLGDTLTETMQGLQTLVLDFDKVEYISSSGLRVLLSAQKTMNKQGSMVIRNVNSDIMDIFDVTGFTDILTIE